MEHLKLRMCSGGKKNCFEKDMLVKSGESSIYPKFLVKKSQTNTSVSLKAHLYT